MNARRIVAPLSLSLAFAGSGVAEERDPARWFVEARSMIDDETFCADVRVELALYGPEGDERSRFVILPEHFGRERGKNAWPVGELGLGRYRVLVDSYGCGGVYRDKAEVAARVGEDDLVHRLFVAVEQGDGIFQLLKVAHTRDYRADDLLAGEFDGSRLVALVNRSERPIVGDPYYGHVVQRAWTLGGTQLVPETTYQLVQDSPVLEACSRIELAEHQAFAIRHRNPYGELRPDGQRISVYTELEPDARVHVNETRVGYLGWIGLTDTAVIELPAGPAAPLLTITHKMASILGLPPAVEDEHP